MIITEEQLKSIESLTPECKEALVSYGGEMYRQGLIRGALCVVVTGIVVSFVSRVVIELKKSKVKESKD